MFEGSVNLGWCGLVEFEFQKGLKFGIFVPEPTLMLHIHILGNDT